VERDRVNVYEHIAKVVSERVDELAIVEQDPKGRDTALTYAEYDAQVKRLCAALAHGGVSEGDRVIVLIPMQIELYVCMTAIMRMGAVTVFVDPHMPRAHFDNCCKVVEPKAFIGIPKAHLFRLGCKHLRKVPLQLTTGRLPGFIAKPIGGWLRTPLEGEPPPMLDVADDHPALIGFTTGSSGAPRGSTRTHGFLNAQIAALFQPEEKRQSTVDLPGFPVLPLDNLVRGRATILPRFPPGKVAEVEVDTLLNQVDRYAPDMMSGAPAYLEAICGGAEAVGRTLDSVRILFTGGAPMAKTGLARLCAVWPNARVVVVYGSTEAEPVARIDAAEIIDECYALSTQGHGYCVGYPIDEIETLIMPLDFSDSSIDDLSTVALPNHCIGEIAVRGAHVNTQYWNDPAGEEKNKIQSPSGTWHRMGDAGYRDAKGRLWLVGRSHTAMTPPWAPNPSDGHRPFAPGHAAWIFPYQVEAIANDMEGVKRSAYVGANQGYHLVVEPMDGDTDTAALERALTDAMAGFPLTRMAFRSLPVDPRHNTKIDYTTVVKWLEEQGT
jgi:acyl-coenzyme A synthetase/AMP-(fatty) acid ligase